MLASPLPVRACPYPDEGNMPLRRAVSQVKFLPETEAWSKAHGGKVVYVLQLENTRQVRGRCYWTVDAVSDGTLWQRFYVTPDGKRILAQSGRGVPVTLQAWREKQ